MSFWKSMPYVAGGIGLASLENQALGKDLPSSMKGINMGVGASTGLLYSMPSEAAKITALSSIPLKQMALLGLNSADKFRKQQQELTDTNLNTAKINQSAAGLHLRDAGSSRAIQLAFLIPALVGAGALGYSAYDKYKKEHKGTSKFKNITESGKRTSNQRLRLEMPVSALPPDFASSLMSARDRSHFTVKEKEDDNEMPVARGRRKEASMLQNAGKAVWDLTGIPNMLRGGKDLMTGYGSLNDSDYGNTARYMGAGLGNLAMGTALMRWGAWPMARLLGRARLQGVIRNALKGESNQLRDLPTAAKFILKHDELANWGSRARPRYEIPLPSPIPGWRNTPESKLLAVHAFDPARYAWNNPTTQSSVFKGLFTAPAAGAGPKTMAGTLGMGASYLGNRAVNAGYGARQLMRRYPNATLTLAGMPFANEGTIRDERDEAQQKALWDQYLPQGGNTGPMGMPISSVANSVLRAMSGTPEPVARQLSGI